MSAGAVKKKRVACYIDGFNFYHAVKELRQDHLKWVNLRALMGCFSDPNLHEITAIYYFSAIAEWLPGPAQRHREYIAALETVGITPILGKFKEKDRACRACNSKWKAHEEKESDVNIAIELVCGALSGAYEEAFLVTRDSDMVPAVKKVLAIPGGPRIKIIAPPNMRHSKELLQAVGKSHASMKEIHLARSLLPQHVTDANGKLIVTRPAKYDPPI